MTFALTNAGRAVFAQALYAQDYFLAWGDLPPSYPAPWTDPTEDPLVSVNSTTITRGAGTTDTLPHTPLTILSVVRGGTTYMINTDFLVVGNTIDWSPIGIQPVETQTYTVTYRYDDPNKTTLIQELGRKKLGGKSYVIPDVAGTITVAGQNYTKVQYPTRYLLLEFRFDSTAAATKSIAQLGIYTNTVRTSGTSPSKTYLVPSEIQDIGKLWLIENIVPFTRISGKREYFNFVLFF